MSWNWLSGIRGEPHLDTNKDPINQDRTRRKASSTAPLHSHDPVKSRGKTLTRTRKKKGRMKKKSQRTTSATSKNKLYQRHKELCLSRKEGTWHRPRINRPPQSNKKFRPPSSSIGRKRLLPSYATQEGEWIGFLKILSLTYDLWKMFDKS